MPAPWAPLPPSANIKATRTYNNVAAHSWGPWGQASVSFTMDVTTLPSSHLGAHPFPIHSPCTCGGADACPQLWSGHIPLAQPGRYRINKTTVAYSGLSMWPKFGPLPKTFAGTIQEEASLLSLKYKYKDDERHICHHGGRTYLKMRPT